VASYEQLNGVRTWYDRHGDGDALVLLTPEEPVSTRAPSLRTSMR
jgi:hypothetical protein